MRKQLEELVRRRAQDRCEYCGVANSWLQTPFQIDHIISQKHGGPTTPQNLALSCFHCNIHKGSDIASLDEGVLTRLLNPREDRWSDHLTLGRDGAIQGLTSIGRVTVRLLQMNDSEVMRLRQIMMELGIIAPGKDRGWT
jgi:hypothetical protein